MIQVPKLLHAYLNNWYNIGEQLFNSGLAVVALSKSVSASWPYKWASTNLAVDTGALYWCLAPNPYPCRFCPLPSA